MGTICERIRDVRVRALESRQEFADNLGIHVNTVGRYERGQSEPDLSTIATMCRIYEINPYWLLYGEANGVEYPISSNRVLTMNLQSGLPKAGHYRTLTKECDSFDARTTVELIDTIKTNMHLYESFSFIYYENSRSKSDDKGYCVTFIGKRGHNEYDFYGVELLYTKDNFFITDIINILSHVYKFNVELYEKYCDRGTFTSILENFSAKMKEADTMHVSFTRSLFFGNKVEIPSILRGFRDCSLIESER